MSSCIAYILYKLIRKELYRFSIEYLFVQKYDVCCEKF